MPSDRNPVPAALGVPDAPRLMASASGGFGMSFFELDCFQPNLGLTKPVRDDAFVIALQLTRCDDFDLYADGRLIRPQQFGAGAVAIFDLRTTLVTDLRDPFHAIDLYLPLAALNAMSDELGTGRVDELRHTPGTAVFDTTVRSLLLSMQPSLAEPPEYTSRLFVDHVAQAIATHLAQTYGGLRVPARSDGGGLAPIHAQRTKELLNANLSGRLLLTDLASACNLSVRQFTRAFRQTTGVAPHQWLVRRRIETAKDLLSRTTQTIASIASDCGFADQSHLTRVFSRRVGMAPAEWRRIRRR
jgi:AraC family transcriptional regulator